MYLQCLMLTIPLHYGTYFKIKIAVYLGWREVLVHQQFRLREWYITQIITYIFPQKPLSYKINFAPKSQSDSNLGSQAHAYQSKAPWHMLCQKHCSNLTCGFPLQWPRKESKFQLILSLNQTEQNHNLEDQISTVGIFCLQNTRTTRKFTSIQITKVLT